MNRVVLTGRVATDPVFNETQGGESARFRLAVRKPVKTSQTEGEQPNAEFFTIMAYGNKAQLVRSYFKKGLHIGVDGKLRSRTFTGDDGSQREIVDVVADSFDFLSSRSEASGNDHVPPPVQAGSSGNHNYPF